MKKYIIKVLALILTIATIAAVFVVPVSAATATAKSSIKFTGTSSGGFSQYFYVQTGTSTNSRKVSLKMGEGTMWSDTEELYAAKMPVYGAYEIKIYYWNGSKWVKEQNYDIYNASSATITLQKKNTTYKVQIYNWRVSTIYTSYWNQNVKCTDGKKFQKHFSSSMNYYGAPKWGSLPTIKVTPKSGCKVYSSDPLK